VVRKIRVGAPQEKFLGVRLTVEELNLLDEFATRTNSRNRSDAVRSLVRAAGETRPDAVELPLQVRAELESIVEDGWAADVSGALTALVTTGLEAFARLHAEALPKLRDRARENASRQDRRRRADREGRGLLGR
jgi:hypothetical protein